MVLCVKVLEIFFIEWGYIDIVVVEKVIDYYENEVGFWNGVKVVVKVWSDLVFKLCLFDNGM